MNAEDHTAPEPDDFLRELLDSTVDGVVRRTAARVPDRVAVRYADRAWTYAELDAAVSTAAAELRGHGLEDGDRAASYGHNSSRSGPGLSGV
ncbi:AMP-binding protein [Streptomyces scopuliridis]|uniref:AMP-binding protein n=1 Tax=Streptomyces scopuliridis TaxID=452529 RepID=UPI003688FB85